MSSIWPCTLSSVLYGHFGPFDLRWFCTGSELNKSLKSVKIVIENPDVFHLSKSFTPILSLSSRKVHVLHSCTYPSEYLWLSKEPVHSAINTCQSLTLTSIKIEIGAYERPQSQIFVMSHRTNGELSNISRSACCGLKNYLSAKNCALKSSSLSKKCNMSIDGLEDIMSGITMQEYQVFWVGYHTRQAKSNIPSSSPQLAWLVFDYKK